MLMISLFLSLLFLLLNHPMAMGLLLLIQSTMITLITGTLNFNFWFSYILFLIMVGGMLVLFIYMTSIASNELFSMSKNLILILTCFLMMMLMYFIFDNYYFNLNQMLLESNSNLMINHNLTKYFNYPSIIVLFLMMMYLFITLIAVVKITKIEYGPLRQYY